MNKLIKITIFSLFLLAFVLQGINTYISNSRVIEGISAGELTQELIVIQEENIVLESKVLELSSFRNVASRAAEIGFEFTRDFVSLYDPIEVAIGR